jgi:hypothetical protein
MTKEFYNYTQVPNCRRIKQSLYSCPAVVADDENDTQSNLCTIKDPNMEPFYIVKDATNFTVMELSTSMRGFAGKKATGKEVEKIIGHYSNFSNALNRVAKEKFYQNENSYNSIQDYIETWNTVKEGIETMLNKVKL